MISMHSLPDKSNNVKQIIMEHNFVVEKSKSTHHYSRKNNINAIDHPTAFSMAQGHPEANKLIKHLPKFGDADYWSFMYRGAQPKDVGHQCRECKGAISFVGEPIVERRGARLQLRYHEEVSRRVYIL
jgi:hypothetical protein